MHETGVKWSCGVRRIDGHSDPQHLGYLKVRFHRLPARRDVRKAIVAVASMLTAAWHVLRDSTERHDVGASHFDRAAAAKTAGRLIRRLQRIG